MTAKCYGKLPSYNFIVNFVIESNMLNRLDYDGRFTVKVELTFCGITFVIPDQFLERKMNFSRKIEICQEHRSVSFGVKLSVSCYSNFHNCVDTTVVSKQIINNNMSMLNDSTHSDSTFIVEEKEFKVHKNILAATSPVFAKLLNSKMKESIKNECIGFF